jgi:hypothetical protein
MDDSRSNGFVCGGVFLHCGGNRSTSLPTSGGIVPPKAGVGPLNVFAPLLFALF